MSWPVLLYRSCRSLTTGQHWRLAWQLGSALLKTCCLQNKEQRLDCHLQSCSSRYPDINLVLSAVFMKVQDNYVMAKNSPSHLDEQIISEFVTSVPPQWSSDSSASPLWIPAPCSTTGQSVTTFYIIWLVWECWQVRGERCWPCCWRDWSQKWEGTHHWPGLGHGRSTHWSSRPPRRTYTQSFLHRNRSQFWYSKSGWSSYKISIWSEDKTSLGLKLALVPQYFWLPHAVSM